jgi:hypothetical protein
MEQWPRSPRSQPKKTRKSISASTRSVLARRVFPGDRDRGRMDHVRLDAAVLKPAREPEAVAAGFVGDGDAGDWTPRFDRLTSKNPPRLGVASCTTT